MNRRKVLAGVGSTIAVSLAGCIGRESSSEESGGIEDVREALEGEYAFDGGTVTIKQLGRSQWWITLEDSPARVGLFGSEQEALDEDPPEDVRAVIDETDFETERLLIIGTYGPTSPYTDVRIDSLSLSGDTLVGSGIAYTEHEPDAMEESYPAALLRISFDEDPVDEAQITVTSGGGPSNPVGGGQTVTRKASTE